MMNQRGMSLIEAMIAILIFGIGITIAMRTMPASSAKTSRSRNMTIAINLAQEKTEDLMSLLYSDADLAVGNHTDVGNPIRGHFRRAWTVLDATPVPSMKTVTVTVSFPTASADSIRTLRTIISKRR